MRPEADQGKSVGGDSRVKTPEGGRNKRPWRGGDRQRQREDKNTEVFQWQSACVLTNKQVLVFFFP